MQRHTGQRTTAEFGERLLAPCAPRLIEAGSHAGGMEILLADSPALYTSPSEGELPEFIWYRSA